MRKYLTGLAIVSSLLIALFFFNNQPQPSQKPQASIDSNEIRYVAIGDSYTKGDGAGLNEAWPDLLTKHLQEKGIKIQLVANPSQTGWTTEEVIRYELPEFEKAQPTFATILIGTNDWGVGMEEETFRRNLVTILDRMQRVLPDKQNIVVLTNPDFSFTPLGKSFNARNIEEGMQQFNAIIKEEAAKRNLTVVDLFPVSQRHKDDPEYLSIDGLHPSAKGYAIWEAEIFPAVYRILRDQPSTDETSR